MEENKKTKESETVGEKRSDLISFWKYFGGFL
jgi:hypothetical protein